MTHPYREELAGLWSVTAESGMELAMQSQHHAEAMVEAMASMGITVAAGHWSGTPDEHAACMAESAKWAETAQ